MSAGSALGATYQVGPGRKYVDLSAVPPLAPGDVVEIDGDAAYHGDARFVTPGTKEAPITLRGVRVHGQRPVLSGNDYLLSISADHYVIEGIELTGASSACLFISSDDITVRDSVIHDCPKYGVLSADSGSGSQTFSYVELYQNGDSEVHHQMYIATDETAHPGSVLRVEHSYIHDGKGGNNIKSRAERNEIYFNWIEGAMYHELDLIGPDGQDEDLAREDSDVVGNVLIKKSGWYLARLGGDGTGQTKGRYRFTNNTLIAGPDTKTAIFLQDGIESLEMSNNVLFQRDGGGATVVKDSDAAWTMGQPEIAGEANWLEASLTGVPDGLDGTQRGSDPDFNDISVFDVHLAPKSPLINAGGGTLMDRDGFGFKSPLALPSFLPPPRRLEELGRSAVRLPVGRVDIGAYEFLSAEMRDGNGALDDSGALHGVVCSASPGGARAAGVEVLILGLLALRRRRARRA